MIIFLKILEFDIGDVRFEAYDNVLMKVYNCTEKKILEVNPMAFTNNVVVLVFILHCVTEIFCIKVGSSFEIV